MRKDTLRIDQSLYCHSVKLPMFTNIELFDTISRDVLLNSITKR